MGLFRHKDKVEAARGAAEIAETLSRTVSEVKREQAAVTVPLHGRWWAAAVLLGVLAVLLAPYVNIPGLPADSVLMMPWAYSAEHPMPAWMEGKPWIPWVIYGVLGACLIFAAVPWKASHVRWLRGLSAVTQGFIMGNLFVFDSDTLIFRLTFAVALGFANALDQLGVARRVKRQLLHEIEDGERKVELRVGARGKYKVRSKGDLEIEEDVEVTKVCADGKCEVKLMKNHSKEMCEAVSPKLNLTHYSDEAFTALIREASGNPGFELRCWGFSAGITISQWIVDGITKSDSFVSGMLSGQALMFLCLPPILWICWWAWKRSINPVVRTFCLLIFIGCCTFDIIALLPGTLAVSGFSFVELYTHQIVIYISIPVCYFVFVIAARKFTMGDVASLGLNHIVRNAQVMMPAEAQERLLGSNQSPV